MTINAMNKIEKLIQENISSSAVPIAPFGGGALKIKSSYAKPTIQQSKYTEQDKGAEHVCKK